MLTAIARRHPRLSLPLLAISVALLVAGSYLLAA